MEDLVARADVAIAASKDSVWKALVTPSAIKQYMFGTDVTSNWTQGSEIVWQGEWQGKPYRDKGVILQLVPGRILEYTHFSPLAGLADAPENYHTVTIRLADDGAAGTRVSLSQDNNATDDARRHAEQNWNQMLEGLKRHVESLKDGPPDRR